MLPQLTALRRLALVPKFGLGNAYAGSSRIDYCDALQQMTRLERLRLHDFTRPWNFSRLDGSLMPALRRLKLINSCALSAEVLLGHMTHLTELLLINVPIIDAYKAVQRKLMPRLTNLCIQYGTHAVAEAFMSHSDDEEDDDESDYSLILYDDDDDSEDGD
jgi:hypothetical protein